MEWPLFDVWLEYRDLLTGGTRGHGERAIALEPPQEGDRVLDIACGAPGVSEGFVCKSCSAIGPRGEGVSRSVRTRARRACVGVDLGRADVLVAHPFLEGAEADLA